MVWLLGISPEWNTEIMSSLFAPLWDPIRRPSEWRTGDADSSLFYLFASECVMMQFGQKVCSCRLAALLASP